MQSLKEECIPYRVAEWVPSDHAHLTRWLDGMIQKTDARSRALHPVIADFQDLIESDPEVFMLFNQMFEQVPRRAPYHKDPTGKPQVRDYRQMLQLLDTIMTHAPEYDQTGLVGCPIRTGALVYVGQHVNKGDPIGVFHYGGSTHCLIFRPGVRLEFDHHGQKPGLHAQPIPVNARIARPVK